MDPILDPEDLKLKNMKTIFTLLASTLMSVSLFAAEAKPSGSIFVKSNDNSKIRVVLDGKKFEPNDDAVIITGITQGFHNVIVYKQRNNGFFNQRSSKFEVVYNGSVDVKRRTSHNITIGRNNQVTMNAMKETNGRQGNEYDYNDGYGNNNQWDDYDNGASYKSSMNNRDFERVLQSIDKEWLEGNKIKSATQVVRSNALTAAQVKQLVQLFTFENNKLELAKQAYQNTVDKRNYYLVADLLSFNANKAELEKYIRNYR
ncbi:MAG: DUF4476 domain-containing protein [Chitinophagaceae bacterium]|nr:MAG: DUF4476 domain-containing protein [Chitinophagaceae bacterium]